MERLILKITPLSSFVTYPKGDTLFGQILAYLFLDQEKNREVLNAFSGYLTDEKPSLIVSDMMPYGYVYRPTLPLKAFTPPNGKEIDKKKLRKQKFISLENLQKGELHKCEKIDFMSEFVSVKNSINRTTFTTGNDDFAPYGMSESDFYKELWMFILVDKRIKDKILEVIKEIGQFGFGKEGNLGKGRFEVKLLDISWEEIDTPFHLTLSPTLLEDNNIEKSWYEPFTRFGKYGLHHAHTNAFKRPVLMADSSAVVQLETSKEYVGNSLNNGTEEKISYLQGYSIALPFVLKDSRWLK